MSGRLTMENMRAHIRAALTGNPLVTGAGLARELEISPAQVTSMLKPNGRQLRIDEIAVVERYLGITLIEPGTWQEQTEPVGEGYAIPGTDYVAVRRDPWLMVYDGDRDTMFMVKSNFPLEHLGAVAAIRDQAFRKGEDYGRREVMADLRKLIGAKAEH